MCDVLPVEELDAWLVWPPTGPAPLSGLLLLDPLGLSEGVVVVVVDVVVGDPLHIGVPSWTMAESSSSGGASSSLGHSSSELLGGFGGGALAVATDTRALGG